MSGSSCGRRHHGTSDKAGGSPHSRGSRYCCRGTLSLRYLYLDSDTFRTFCDGAPERWSCTTRARPRLCAAPCRCGLGPLLALTLVVLEWPSAFRIGLACVVTALRALQAELASGAGALLLLRLAIRAPNREFEPRRAAGSGLPKLAQTRSACQYRDALHDNNPQRDSAIPRPRNSRRAERAKHNRASRARETASRPSSRLQPENPGSADEKQRERTLEREKADCQEQKIKRNSTPRRGFHHRKGVRARVPTGRSSRRRRRQRAAAAIITLARRAAKAQSCGRRLSSTSFSMVE